MFETKIDQILGERAASYQDLRFLEVDFYRIRRRMAFPLPLTSLDQPKQEVTGIPGYPWGVWIMWELEERLCCLAHASIHLGSERAHELYLQELETFVKWPGYRMYDHIDLSYTTSMRILIDALRHYPKLPNGLKDAIHARFKEQVDENIDWYRVEREAYTEKEKILDSHNNQFHNIAIISMLMMCTTSRIIKHDINASMEKYCRTLLEALFTLGETGLTESFAYDGFILDHMADWLFDAPQESKDLILNDPRFDTMLEQMLYPCAPGNSMELARIGDVEPYQMTFYIGALSKFKAMGHRVEIGAYFEKADLSLMFANTLRSLHTNDAGNFKSSAPLPLAKQTPSNLVIRSGWEHEDIAASLASPLRPMGHLHFDRGHLQVGTRGKWFIDDPGYQQYMPTSEREFAIGPEAHNCPIIGGQSQNQMTPEVLKVEDLGQVQHAAINIRPCYEDFEVDKVERHAWVCKQTLVLCDAIEAPQAHEITYHWMAHPDAFWRIDAEQAVVVLDHHPMTINCSHGSFADEGLTRRKGSRGQLTFTHNVPDISKGVIWWIFSFGSPETFEISDKKLSIAGQTLSPE